MTQRPKSLFALFGALILAHGVAFALHGTEPVRFEASATSKMFGCER